MNAPAGTALCTSVAGSENISFLSSILPDQGIYFVATKQPSRGFVHHACHSIDEVVQKAQEIDARGQDAYMACASYKQESYVEPDGKHRQRTGENAGWAKSFWLDIDCGAVKAEDGKGYLTLDAALVALARFVKTVGLPEPSVVMSGGGLHVYFLLSEAITKQQWKPVAVQLKALTRCPATRLIADDSRTSDIASILRPVGTHNHKPERGGAEVALTMEGTPTPFADFSQIIKYTFLKHCGSNAPPRGTLQLGTPQSPPDPETHENIARVKSALAVIDPDSEYPLWRDICFAIHASGWTCAEELARSWSSPATKYDPAEFVKLWSSIKPGGGVGMGTLFHHAKEKGWTDASVIAAGSQVSANDRNYGPSAESNVAPDQWPDPKEIKAALLPVPLFDLDMLPDVFKPLVADVSELMQAPGDFIAVPLMVAAAATLGNGWAIAPKAKDLSWMVPPVLWGAIIGRPGTKKSPAMNKALVPLLKIEEALAKAHDAKLQQYQSDKLVYEAALKKAKALAKSGTVPLFLLEPEEPQPERLLVNDSTYQKLGDILRWSPRGVITVADELVGLLEGLGANGQESARAFYLDAWNGDQPHRVDRVVRGSFVISRLSVNVLGGMQPGKLQNYIRQATRGGINDDGLMQRFQLLVWPDISSDWVDIDRYHDHKAFDDAMDAFLRLRDLKPTDVQARTNFSGTTAYLQFDTDAQVRFIVARSQFEIAVRSGQSHTALEAHYSKYPRMIAALALVIHLVDGGVGPVSLEAVNKAIKWTIYLGKHAQRAYGAADNAAAQSAKALSEKIKEGKIKTGFTARVVQRKQWQYLSTKEDVEHALEWLIDNGWIKCEEKIGIGRSSKVYTVNPKIHG